MSDIEKVLLRLKERLGVSSDKALAELLGMGEKALNARKKRGVPLKDKVLELAATRPELGLDVDYILTGEPGGYTVVRAAQLREWLHKMAWDDARLARELGLRGADATAFCDQLMQAVSGFRMRNAHVERLENDWHVRREFLVHGVQPMHGPRVGDAAALAARIQRLEVEMAGLVKLVTALHDAGKASTRFQEPLKKPAKKPPPKADTPTAAQVHIAGAQQNFHGNVSQVAGGNIINKAGKKR